MEKPKIPYTWRIAAFILLISIVAFMFRKSYRKHAPELIYNKYFQPYEAPTNLRGSDIAEVDDDFMLALIKYDRQEYAEAIALFEKAYENDHQNYTARFLMAVAYMSQKDFTQAEPILRELSNDDSHLFQDQARWYLGLLYLTDYDKTNNEKATELFEKIQSPNLKNKATRLR